MVFDKLHYLPIFAIIWLGSAFIICYVIAVLNKHVNPLFPYISDTGNFVPDSCIFGIMLTIGGIVMILIFYLRYKHLNDLIIIDSSSKIGKLNKSSMIISLVAVIGLFLVASFQETFVFIPHLIGANLCFGFLGIYQILQVIISFQILNLLGKKVCVIIRCIACCIFCACFIVSFVSGGFAWTKFNGKDLTKWSKEDGGFEIHLVSVITEWIMAITGLIFIATFTEEFRIISCEEPKISLKI